MDRERHVRQGPIYNRVVPRIRRAVLAFAARTLRSWPSRKFLRALALRPNTRAASGPSVVSGRLDCKSSSSFSSSLQGRLRADAPSSQPIPLCATCAARRDDAAAPPQKTGKRRGRKAHGAKSVPECPDGLPDHASPATRANASTWGMAPPAAPCRRRRRIARPLHSIDTSGTAAKKVLQLAALVEQRRSSTSGRSAWNLAVGRAT